MHFCCSKYWLMSKYPGYLEEDTVIEWDGGQWVVVVGGVGH